MLNQLHIAFDHDDFVVVHKPFGFRVHRVSETQWGLVETCSAILGRELWPVHRLDKGTSGLLIFAKSKSASQKFFELFESKNIKKTYRFLTKPLKKKLRAEATTEITVESHIEKVGALYISHTNKDANSKTHFVKNEELGSYELWTAIPETGKPHQIRLHAESMGLSILGDSDHGGDPYFRMALHAESLNFRWNESQINIQSPLPADFGQFVKPSPKSLNITSIGVQLQAQQDNISGWINLKKTDCFLLQERNFQSWAAEKLGSVLWIKNYGPNFSDSSFQELKSFCQQQNLSGFIRTMKDRGKGVGGEEQTSLQATDPSLTKWEVCENGLRFEMRSDAGFSPGLFLDQRETRSWVHENSASKNVLNLFSYTGGFSVNAASGNARQVTTVDVSSTFLEWSKTNFRLNDLATSEHEFFKQDVLLFLSGALKRGRTWDLIICDPPTFGRSKDRVWRLEKDFPELIKILFQLLGPKGSLLFTCNFEDWNSAILKEKVGHFISPGTWELNELPLPPIDFGCIDSQKQMSYGFILQKRL